MPDSATTVYVVPHTHWDREWYSRFEDYRARLVTMVGKLLDLLERDPAFRSFTFDGHTIAMEDHLAVRPADRVRIEHRGTAKRGFPIEEVSHSRGNGYVSTTKVELLEFSAAALDKALFTVPHGYQPALPRLTGGFDLTRPDTLRNRLQSYWEDLVSWGQHVFRF